jgi:hypothetical protein
VKHASKRVRLLTYMQYVLGYFDDETCRLESIENPFGPTVLPTSSERSVTHAPGMDQGILEAPSRF